MCSLLLTDRHSQIEGWLLIALGCKQREDVAVIMLLLHWNDICGPFPLHVIPCMTEICIQEHVLWHLYFNLILYHNCVRNFFVSFLISIFAHTLHTAMLWKMQHNL